MSIRPYRRKDNLAVLQEQLGAAKATRWTCTAFFSEAERQALATALKVEKGRVAGSSKDRTQALDAVLRDIQQRNLKLFREE